MDFKEADLKELASHDHEVLGSDFCSGYTDIFGKWNTGFECPRMSGGETVYCCGTVLYKYCCTRKEQHSGTGISQSVLLGSTIGSVMVVVLVALVSCIVCKKCPPYRRPHPSLNGGPLYNLHCSSTTSGMANLYSFSGQTTASTTPMDNPHTMINLEAMDLHRNQHLVRSFLRDETPTDPPPPYNENAPSHNPGSTVNISTLQASYNAGGGDVPSDFSRPTHQQPKVSCANSNLKKENVIGSTKF